MIQLTKKQYALVRNILCSQLKTHKVYVFGSRAVNNARKFSDLDLCIDGELLNMEKIATLKDAFSESDLPYFVDVVQKLQLSDAFYQSIKKDFVLFC